VKHLQGTAVAVITAALALLACGERDRHVTDAPSALTQSSTSKPPMATGDSATDTAGPAATGRATGTSSSTTAPSASMTAADREFAKAAASSDLMEIEAGRMALERTQSDAVHNFAQQMVDDHTKTSQQLASIARDGGLTEAMQLTPVHAAELDKLRGMNGRDFDREYVAQAAVAAHQQAVALFERAARDASNPQLKTFAEQTLLHLRDHLKQSQALAKQIGVPGERLKIANAAGKAVMSPGSSPTDSEATPSGSRRGGEKTGPGG
jgi:putative membrane protein